MTLQNLGNNAIKTTGIYAVPRMIKRPELYSDNNLASQRPLAATGRDVCSKSRNRVSVLEKL